MKKIFLIGGIVILALILGIFVFNIYEADTKVTEGTTYVGLILNGSRSDGNWSEAHYTGLSQTAEKLNLTIIYKENVTNENIGETIENLIERGCEIIIANSFEFGDAVQNAAESHPHIYFFHATGVHEAKNLSSYFGRMYQIRYLCGVLAGLQTKTDEIGYVASFPISEVNRGINAFALGVQSVNPDATVYVRWTNSWYADEEAEVATTRLLEDHNIDLIAMHTDSLKPLEVAEAKDIKSIGYNVDNSVYYPQSFLTGAVWDWEKFYTPHILKCLQGKFQGGHYWENVNSGIVSLSPFTSNVDKGIEEIVMREMERLNSGTFDVFYGPIVDTEGHLRVAEGESMTDYSMLNEFDWYVRGVVIDED